MLTIYYILHLLLVHDLFTSTEIIVQYCAAEIRQRAASTCNGYSQHVEILLCLAIFQSRTSSLHNNSTIQQSYHQAKVAYYYLLLIHTAV